MAANMLRDVMGNGGGGGTLNELLDPVTQDNRFPGLMNI